MGLHDDDDTTTAAVINLLDYGPFATTVCTFLDPTGLVLVLFVICDANDSGDDVDRHPLPLRDLRPLRQFALRGR